MKNMGFLNNKKGFGGVASTLIMFIAIVSITTGIVISFISYTAKTEQSFKVQSDITSNKLKTSILISNIYYNTSSNYLYVYIKNIGETKLHPQLFDLFINGLYETGYNTVYADNLSNNITLFMPQDTMVIVQNITLISGSHEVKVSCEYGNKDSDLFNI